MRGTRLAASLPILTIVAASCGSSSVGSSATTSTTAAPSTRTTGAAGTTSPTTGLSPTEVRVANISILSGPVPGLFQGAPNGVEAFFAYQNSKGGVFGRKLVLDSQDDGFQCTQNQALAQSDLAVDFAFVGSFSLFDNCSGRVLAQNADIPDVSFSLDPVAQALPNNFSPQPLENGWRTGSLAYYKQKYPQAVKAVGTLVGNVPSAIDSWNGEKAAMTSMGYHVAYERLYNPLETDFTSDVLRMRQAGVQMVSLTQADVKTVARVLNAMQAQGFHPQVITAGGVAYDGSLFKLVNPGAAEGLLNDQQQAMYLGEDQATNPEVALFRTWMGKVHPNFPTDIFTVYGWTSARLFVQALQAAGPNPTRASVLAALRNVHSYDSNGLLAASDPADKRAPTCWLLIRIHSGKYERYQDPSTGFRCDGGYFVTK